MRVWPNRVRVAASASLPAIALVWLIAGCQRGGEVVLHQPFAPPSQQELKLASRWTFCATDAGRRNFLLAFPLPGSEAGPRDFLLYISAPDAQGALTVAPGAANSVRGFLIQMVGKLAGRTSFVAGTIECRQPWFLPGLWRVNLDVRCEDGTRITGLACVQPVPHEVHAFEHRHAADIALLRSTASQPASTAEQTAPRRSTPPESQ